MSASVYVPRERDGNQKVQVFNDQETHLQPAQAFNGRPIVSIENGEKIGTISDILIDPENMRVAGLLISRSNLGSLGSLLNRQNEVFPADAVQVWGNDVVLVHHVEQMIETDSQELEKWARVSDQIKNHYVVSIDGTRVGQVDDAMINSAGQVAAYSLSQVFIEGPMAESKRIPAQAIRSLGRDVLIVDLSKI